MDLRHSLEGREKGDERAKLGIDVFVRRVRKYLGAYLVHLGGKVDAVVFSAGGWRDWCSGQRGTDNSICV